MGDMHKNSVLLIDSDLKAAKALSEALDKENIDVVIASDKNSVQNSLKTVFPDIILIDIDMTGGSNILESIKYNKSLNKIPAIALTSEYGDGSFSQTALPDADDYIKKPYSFSEVSARIRMQFNLLEIKKANQDLIKRNLILQQITLTDELTGLFNRRYVIHRLAFIISHSARYEEPVSFIMLDIDYFKKINDTYGHLVGDTALKQVAGQIKKSVRDSDIAIRYGGEEFLIVCTATDAEGAKALGDRIRRNIKNLRLKHNENIICITASLGISSESPKPHSEPEMVINNLIHNADIALYRAKANGRNRIELFSQAEALPAIDSEANSNNQINYGRTDNESLNH